MIDEKINYPKISIVTISFNQGEYLEQTILSVLNQQYPNLEYIIIDGGSTDNSVEIIRKYESKLAYWVSEKDKGMYDAIQKGFEKSTGEIMAWINSDDCYHTNSFFVVSEIFSQFQKVEWLQGMPSIIDESGRIVMVLDFRRWAIYDYLSRDKAFIQQESCFWRRSLWERSGGTINTSLKYAGDYALWLTFFDYAELYCTNTIIGGFRMRTKNQFSLEKMDEYHAEGNALLSIRENKMTARERKNLILFSIYRNFIFYIPVLRLAYYYNFIERLYPPRILFDRITQRFFITEQIHKNFFVNVLKYLKRKIKGDS